MTEPEPDDTEPEQPERQYRPGFPLGVDWQRDDRRYWNYPPNFPKDNS